MGKSIKYKANPEPRPNGPTKISQDAINRAPKKLPNDASDVRAWIGKDGVVHGIGTGIISIFVGEKAGQQIGGIIGRAEDAGLDAIDENQE